MKLHIYGALKNYKSRRPLRLHMPGHKAEKKLFPLFKDAPLDITELSFSDCLENADGVIREAEADIAEILGAKRSHLLTDGSTAGVYAMLYAAKKRGGKIAIARNSHKSVYNACRVLGIEPYLLRNNERDGILLPPAASDVEDAFKKEPNLCGVLITSPDYFGNVADLAGIRKVCGRYGKLLLADGAHGAAMRFDADEKAGYAGNFAQAWVDGAHKTLPTLTQGAILNVNDEELEESIAEGLDLFRTTSPSYPIMASVEYGVKFMQEQGAALIDAFRRQFAFIKARLKKRGVRFYEDSRTLVLAVDFGGAGIRAQAAAEELERRGIFAELEDGRYVLFYFSPLTRVSALSRLERAICSVWRMKQLRGGTLPQQKYVSGIKKFSYLTAHTLAYEYIPVGDSAGRIAARNAGITPPCYPIVIAGEQITPQAMQALSEAAHTFGLKDKKIAVTKIGGRE